MNIKQNDLEYLKDMMQQGKMTVNEANVKKVRMQRVLLVTSRLTSDVRKALNSAVKNGYLSHLKKDGRKPEVYFHPDFDYLANEERIQHEFKILNALKSLCY